MTAPTSEPRNMQIMTALTALLAAISQANGYYTNVAGAGIEPLAFDSGDTYPQIVLQEELAAFGDTNARGYTCDLTLAARGFMPFVSGSAMSTAFRLLDDITRCLQSVQSKNFIGADGSQLVSTIALAGSREVKNSDEHADFVEVIVRVQVSYRVFYPST